MEIAPQPCPTHVAVRVPGPKDWGLPTTHLREPERSGGSHQTVGPHAQLVRWPERHSMHLAAAVPRKTRLGGAFGFRRCLALQTVVTPQHNMIGRPVHPRQDATTQRGLRATCHEQCQCTRPRKRLDQVPRDSVCPSKKAPRLNGKVHVPPQVTGIHRGQHHTAPRDPLPAWQAPCACSLQVDALEAAQATVVVHWTRLLSCQNLLRLWLQRSGLPYDQPGH
mmetsp:Transcript_104504/g.337030  ORF Transcript_104504/g.337030 Transcript_104504/m.337030 type:complete len:222 (+) Transcript_104504:933-1598(+)